MKLIIDISEDVYTRLFDNGTEDYAIVNDDLFKIAKSIRKGTPLPEGHGDLVDKNTLEGHYVCSIGLDEACVLKCKCKDCSSRAYQLYDDLDDVPVVVEADKDNK